MTRPSEDFDDPIRTIGADATSTFDDTASNPTEHASSEALDAATDVDDEPDPVSESDDAIEPAIAEGADEEAPIDGEYLSDPEAADNDLEESDDLDLDEEDETDEADEAELDTDNQADLNDEASPQASVGESKPAPGSLN